MNQEFERYMTDDLRIKEIRELAPPAHLIHEFPCTDKASATVQHARNAGHSIIHGPLLDPRSESGARIRFASCRSPEAPLS